jgi:hypothetical protein
MRWLNIIDRYGKHIKKYGFIFMCIRFIGVIYLNYILCYWNELLKYMRHFRIIRNNKFSKIKTYKDIHKGERCFIVCTGPSLTYRDLEMLKGEISFGMNSIIKGFQNTDWRPTYYGIQDRFVYEELQDYIYSEVNSIIFIADVIEKRKYKIPSDAVDFPLSYYKHFLSGVKYCTKFSSNPSALVYDGYTITYSLLQIAVYMGFKDIYLLGCDCFYSADPQKQHFVESKRVDPTFSVAKDRMISAYKEAKKYADKHYVSIYNATRGGYLEVFDRVSLDDILSQNKREL